jgi:hypothetical protein
VGPDLRARVAEQSVGTGFETRITGKHGIREKQHRFLQLFGMQVLHSTEGGFCEVKT